MTCLGLVRTFNTLLLLCLPINCATPPYGATTSLHPFTETHLNTGDGDYHAGRHVFGRSSETYTPASTGQRHIFKAVEVELRFSILLGDTSRGAGYQTTVLLLCRLCYPWVLSSKKTSFFPIEKHDIIAQQEAVARPTCVWSVTNSGAFLGLTTEVTQRCYLAFYLPAKTACLLRCCKSGGRFLPVKFLSQLPASYGRAQRREFFFFF